jgi:hypothetical protein
MKASRSIFHRRSVLLLFLGFDLLVPRRLILDYPDVCLGGGRADVTI